MAYETDWSGQLHSTVHLYPHPRVWRSVLVPETKTIYLIIFLPQDSLVYPWLASTVLCN